MRCSSLLPIQVVEHIYRIDLLLVFETGFETICAINLVPCL